VAEKASWGTVKQRAKTLFGLGKLKENQPNKLPVLPLPFASGVGFGFPRPMYKGIRMSFHPSKALNHIWSMVFQLSRISLMVRRKLVSAGDCFFCSVNACSPLFVL
jgi:hypothetical protein